MHFFNRKILQAKLFYKQYLDIFKYKVCQKETDSRMGTENMPQKGFSRDFYDNLILLIHIHYIVIEIPKK
jgi:hypothetical protein